MPEADARIVIDRLLREAGWDPEDKSQVATEEAAGDGFADYMLLDARGRPAAVVEAKRFSIDPYSAKERTLDYARSLRAPFIFLSNGETHYFWDYEEADARQIEAFFTRHDLERLAALKRHRRAVSSVAVPDTYVKQGEERQVRPYQKDALRAIDQALERGRRKILIEMATGTGKTDVIALAMRRMFQAGLIERVLFLVDRIELAKQAKDTFDDVLHDYPSVVLYGGRRSREGQIVVGTLDTIRGQLGPGGFSSGYFDLVVTDECHRSIYGEHRYLLVHFDAIQIGLTATPSVGRYAWVNETERRLVRNTYLFFECWNAAEERGEPTFTYGILEGIREGYLADYDIYLAQTQITLEGVDWDDVTYGPNDLERIVTSEDRNALMVSEFVDLEKRRGGNHPRKTIVFAMTKNHAAQLTRFLNRHYPEFKGRYAEQVTCDIPGVDRVIRRFNNELLPVIAVSVGMLDTGFDSPAVENLVMMRPTKSAILYQQMRGRGNRLCKVTRWGTEINKTSFLIYDFAGNVVRFNDPKYDPTKPREPAPPRPPGPPGPEPPPPPKPPRDFVTIPEGSVDDRFVVRRLIEVGPEGLRVDARSYWDSFVQRANEMVDEHPGIQRVQAGDEQIPDEDLVDIEERLNTPEFYFNEDNLRQATDQPFASMLDFLKAAFGRLRFPTRDERIARAFDAWIVDKNLDPEQTRLLRMLKNQVVAGRPPDIGAFNEPPLRDRGGLGLALRLFGEQRLRDMMEELRSGVFA